MTSLNDVRRQQRFEEVVGAYFRAMDEGEIPDQNQLIERHLEIGPELRAFFAGENQLGEVAKQLRVKPRHEVLTEDYIPADNELCNLSAARASRRAIAPGAVLGGRYEVFATQSGGMGQVYLADDLQAKMHGFSLKRALKTVADFEVWKEGRFARGADASLSHYAGLLERFRREAMAWVQIDQHLNIIRAWWVHDIGAKPYLVMEYADCGDLHTWIKEKRLSLPLSLNFAIQFCNGMIHAVDKVGLVHRDIKPANVLIQSENIVKISDLGLAKAFVEETADSLPVGAECLGDAFSHAGGGTPPYMAPEQFQSLTLADTRSDIFSFGAMLFEMVTGIQLFRARTAWEQYTLRTHPIPVAHEVDPRVPRPLSAIITRCLAFHPPDRYASFSDVQADLLRVYSAIPGRLPIPSRDASQPYAILTPSQRALQTSFSLISLGDYAAAACRSQDGIDCDPNNFAHWVNKGTALLCLEDLAEAERCFQRATELNPADARSWSNLGWALHGLGNAAAGLAAATQGIEADERFGEAWMCRGVCEKELGMMDDALNSLHQAVALEPWNWKSQLHYGAALRIAGRSSEAFEAFQLTVEINPQSEDGWLGLGALYVEFESWRKALEKIDRVLNINPSHAAAWALRAWAMWQDHRDLTTTLESLQRGYILDATNETVRLVRSALLKNS